MATSSVRRVHNATNVLHSFVYFAPEAEEHFVSTGLDAGRMCYFAGRAAAMGPVGPGVVTATFYNFSPDLVCQAIPRAWELARPADIICARLEAADAAMTRLLGREVVASDEVAAMARLAREAAGACTGEGRPLYSGHADLDWPQAPHLVLWHALTLLREHRGDGHIAALTASGLSGIEALITHTVTGQGFSAGFARASRGWTKEQWAAAQQGLAERGLLDSQGALTEAGQQLRAKVEEETDEMAAGPWQHLGEEGTAEVTRIGRDLTRAMMAAGAFPTQGVFAAR
ncbi:MAG: hypothetical protein ABJB47_12280 [Actinomycetota bacterium]